MGYWSGTHNIEGLALMSSAGKDRRETGGFVGAETVLKTIKEGPKRRRVGFIVDGAPAREGAPIFAKGGSEQIGASPLNDPDAESDTRPPGTVTSGIPSPTLGANIAMGYVRNGHHKKGTELEVEVRKTRRRAVVHAMPFVPTKYYRG